MPLQLPLCVSAKLHQRMQPTLSKKGFKARAKARFVKHRAVHIKILHRAVCQLQQLQRHLLSWPENLLGLSAHVALQACSAC